MNLVILESPYAGEVSRNTDYARRCLRDCLLRGESPIASHLLYTQPNVLRDSVPAERKLGIEAGLAWLHVSDYSVFYTDWGWSTGMLNALHLCLRHFRPFRVRALYGKPKGPATLHEEIEAKINASMEGPLPCNSLPSATSQAVDSSLPFPLMASPAASQARAILPDSSKKSETPPKPSTGGSEANPTSTVIGRITISGRSVLSRLGLSTNLDEEEPTSK